MKQALAVIALAAVLAGCGTVKGTTSGFLDGASQDLKSLSDKVSK